MPLYEYRCSACAHRFEVRQGFNDPPLASCPQCQGAAQRVIQPVGIVFKGSGWHSTDYRSSSYKKDAGSEKGDGATENATETKGSESKGSETKGSETKGSEAKGSESASPTPAPAANSES